MVDQLEDSQLPSTTNLVNFTSYPSLLNTDSNFLETNNDKDNENDISLNNFNKDKLKGIKLIDNALESSVSNLLHIYKPQNKLNSKPLLKDNLSKFTALDNSKTSKQKFDNSKSNFDLKLSLNLNKTLANTNRTTSGIGRDYWLDDASAIKCRSCDRKFTTFLRKHHCRICGKIFCSSCTTFIDGTKFNYNGKMRVCLLCNNLADKYEDDFFTSEEEEEEEDDDDDNNDETQQNNENKESKLNLNNNNSEFLNEENSTKNPNDAIEKGSKQHSDYKTTLPDDFITNFNDHSLQSSNGKIQISSPTPPPMMTIPTTRSGETVEIDTFKKSFKKKNFMSSNTLNAENNDNQNDSSEDDNEMISFMNNHQFNWPKSTDSKSSKISQNISTSTNNGNGNNNTPHFLTKVNLLKPNPSTALNSIMSLNKSNRRRILKSRYQNRKTSRIHSINMNNKNNNNFDVNSGVQFSDVFQKIGENYASCLLSELLIDKKIENYKEWTNVLIQSLKKINNIEIYLKNKDLSDFSFNESNYNFSNYIKIKKILGSKLEKTKTVEGVVFSKKLPIKTMPSIIENPKIMLITFPIEYDQDINNRHHFQSLESIIAQQDQYIKKLVDRILNLKPNIIISSNSINGLALKLFSNLEISVVPDTKLNNLIKLSKFTGSSIITSIDILAMKPRLGTCDIFKVLNFKFKNTVTSYLLFDGCPNKIGLTIILRDKSDEVLTKVKGCLMIMIYAFINIKLESSFMRDQCLKVDDNSEIKFTDPNDLQPLYSYDFTSYHDFVKLTGQRMISTSPWVKFDKPLIIKQLEANKSRIENNRVFFDSFMSYSHTEKLKSKSMFHIEDLNITDEEDLIKLVKAISNYRENYWKIESLFYLKKWDQFWRSRELTFFDPNYNQNIVVLFSMISRKNSTPCLGPEIQLIDFYWENDFSLGQFIENMCLNANNLCDQNCQLPLKDHYRSYVHDDGKIDIFIEENNSNVLSNNIMNWSICKNCLNSTPILPLNDISYKYSFGKFLELIFWFNSSFGFKILNNNNNCQCNIDNSSFDFFKDYIHYFSFKNFKIHLEYTRIDNLKLVVPKFELFWNPVYDYEIKINHYNDIKTKSSKFFDSVFNRLTRIRLDGTNLSPEEMENGNNKLAELNKKLDVQRQDVALLLSTVYKKSQINEHLKLNTIVREVQELSSFWNFEFESFAKTFLPSEKDIKKITAFQLDRLFKSLASKEDEEEANESETIEEEQEKQTGGDTISKESSQLLNNAQDRAGLSNFNEPNKEKLTKKHKSQLILNKIHELNDNQSNDLFWIQPNKSTNNILDEGKVKQLTKFFDTQEYFDQRELEKQKINKYFSKYKPKVSTMKPKIEVYKSASDAVNSESYKANLVDSNVNLPQTEKSEQEKDTEKEKEVQPEKVSLLKSLTHFWADRSATLWEPLSYPLSSSEHIFVDSDVIVREDEPSSIIAFCLSTNDYQSKLKANNLAVHLQTVPSVEGENSTEIINNFEADKEEKPSFANSDVENVKLKTDIVEIKIPDDQNKSELDLENIMLKKGFHLKYQFEEGYSSILCKIFFTHQFDALRRKCGVSENYIESLARCVKWDSTGGKSGSAFLKTLDQRFIIKELSKAELEAFVHFAPSYFEYFAHVLFHDLPSVLVKIFGFYQIQVKNTLPNAKSYTMDILIMENLFYDRKIDRIFDLKGSMRNRHVEQTGKENEVLLDENMVEYIYESPLFIKENDKRLLRASLWNDTLFLEKMNVMDYSLVVGIDHAKDELVVGIIDCIRTFTWDKKLESWVKEKGLVGNVGVGKEPTVITPKQYKNRFREAMERYILMTPGVYYQGTTT
jgi:1-phosphatidylinositol-3-phosphate 5-kinase